MRGYKIGSTKDVEFTQQKIRITAEIADRFLIPSDSKVEINTLNFMGEKAIMIYPGQSKDVITPESVIQGENKDLMSLAKSILVNTKAKIEEGDLDQAIQTISESVTSLRGLLKNLHKKVNRLDINSYNTQVRKLGETGEEIKNFLDVVKGQTYRLSAEGSDSLTKLNRSLEKIDRAVYQLSTLSSEIHLITQEINRKEGTAGQLIHNKEYIENLNKTILELKAFLEDIQKNPKKYVKFSIF
jgi:phospholipid/cholesterol/gamma-HCH transport system substrate-binding protein